MKKHLAKVPIGDWSGDGHSNCTEYYVMTTHTVEEMQQAYRDTCKKIGLQMNHNENFTGLDEVNGYGHWRQLLTEYQNSYIDKEAVDILVAHGFDVTGLDRDEDSDGDLNGIDFEDDDALRLFMWFIGYSLEGFEYEQIQAPAINGYWGGLNVQIGYGVMGD